MYFGLCLYVCLLPRTCKLTHQDSKKRTENLLIQLKSGNCFQRSCGLRNQSWWSEKNKYINIDLLFKRGERSLEELFYWETKPDTTLKILKCSILKFSFFPSKNNFPWANFSINILSLTTQKGRDTLYPGVSPPDFASSIFFPPAFFSMFMQNV